MDSIKGRMVTVVLAGGGLLLLAGTLIQWSRTERVLVDGFDDALVARVRAMVPLAEVEPDVDLGIEFLLGENGLRGFEPGGDAEYFQLSFSEGTVIAASPSLEGETLAFDPGQAGAPSLTDLVLPDGRAGRAVELDFLPHFDLEEEDDEEAWPVFPEGALLEDELPVLTLVLARGRGGLDRDLEVLVLSTVAVNLAVLLGLALLLLHAGRLVTRPIEAIGHDLRRVDPGHIGGGLPDRSPPRELAPLVEQLDALLGRFRAGLEREKRFTSDVAHELRSPVAKLRLMAEVAAMQEDLSDESREAFDDLEQTARRLEAIVTGLLRLSRAESGRAGDDPVPSSARALVERVVGDLRPAFEARGGQLVGEGPADLTWHLDPAYLTIVLRNLLENALAHGEVGGVVVSYGAEGGRGWLRISNPVEGLEAGQLEHLFERFWRRDESRPADGHFGLGLSIVRAVCELLDWQVRAELEGTDRLAVQLDGLELATDEA